MPLRLIEVMLPNSAVDSVARLVDQSSAIGSWNTRLSDDQSLLRILTEVENSQQLLDEIVSQLSPIGEFRIVLLPVEATLPRPPNPPRQRNRKL